MSRFHYCGLTLMIGLSGFAAAQGPFNFQYIGAPSSFDARAINSGGAIVGTSSGADAIWSAQNGVTMVTTQAGDAYLQKISDTGRVYGTSGGKIISFDVQAGRQVIVSDPNLNFAITSYEQDKLLLRSGSNFYTYDSDGLHSLTTPSGFTPNQILRDGTVLGLVDGGMTMYGVMGYNTVKLNGNGTTSPVLGSQQSFVYNNGGTGASTSQSFGFLGNGFSYMQTSSRSHQTSQSSDLETFQVFGPGGTTYSASTSYYSSNIGGFNSGFVPAVFLSDGTMLGSTIYPPQGRTIFSFGLPSGAEMDSSYFANGSVIPDRILGGTIDGTIMGVSTINGQAVYSMTSISTVPEPASLAVLGLGALAMIRRRKQK